MAHSYHHYYIGDNCLFESVFFKEQPRLLTFSKIQNGPAGETTAHLHSHLEIFYFESGNGIFVSGDQTVPLKAHDLVIANAQNIHMQYSCDPNPPLVYYNFAVDRLKIAGNPQNCISGRSFEAYAFGTSDNPFYHAICNLLRECNEKEYGHYAKINALFTAFLIDTIRLFCQNNNTEPLRKVPAAEILLEVKKYIDVHYSESLNLSHLTQLSYMQKSHFSHSFKKCFGVAPMKYLNLVRIENAKLLLLRSERSVSEIAREVGFSTPSYFSELFLKITGESPSDYRSRVKQQT